ncbi:MAG TPA: outer membrane lipoprotein carrier protein LolA [Deltaproteobacteria bacterium]|nr:outer membrane lipoprotein carrier protein LolA [Deltaproteobacteria bacterium]
MARIDKVVRGRGRSAVVRLRIAVLVFVLGAVGTGRPASAEAAADPAPGSFAELLAGFAGSRGFEARFIEEKTLALLAAPLRSEGHLYFEAPSNLLRRVEKPRRQEILVRRDEVRIRDASGEQVIDLASRGPARPLIQSMIWIFTGDVESLEKVYRIDYRVLEGEHGEGARRWQADLVPKGGPLASLIERLRVGGEGRATDYLEFVETSGDRTLTRIVDVEPGRRFGPEERRELFGAEAK